MFTNKPVAFCLCELKLGDNKLHYALKSHQTNTCISKYIRQVYLQIYISQIQIFCNTKFIFLF